MLYSLQNALLVISPKWHCSISRNISCSRSCFNTSPIIFLRAKVNGFQSSGKMYYTEGLLFAGFHEGAKRAAMMYSFLETCKQNDVEPFAWLKDVISRIPDHKANRLMELLPQNWKPLPENNQ